MAQESQSTEVESHSMQSGGIGPLKGKFLALLVEDNKNLGETIAEILEEAGLLVLVARSRAEAFRILRSSPSVDLLICDIKLSKSPNDRAGIDVASIARSERPSLPIVGYSSYFDGQSFQRNSRNKSIFSFQYSKKTWSSGADEVRNRLEKEWIPEIENYGNRRSELAGKIVDEILDRYGISDQDYWTLCEFLPQTVDGDAMDSDVKKKSLYDRSGYRLRLLDNHELEIRFGVDEKRHTIRQPIPVWLRDFAGQIQAELYRFPEIHASGEDEDSAIQQLVNLLMGVARTSELRQETSKGRSRISEISPELKAFLDYAIYTPQEDEDS